MSKPKQKPGPLPDIGFNKKFLEVHQIALKLNLSIETIYRYIKRGELPAYKFGRTYRIYQTDFEKFLIRGSTIITD